MRITFDPAKREKTLEERDVNFPDAEEVIFGGPTIRSVDVRRNYGEVRNRSFGLLRGRLVLVVWTERLPDAVHIISMRKANEKEQRRILPLLR